VTLGGSVERLDRLQQRHSLLAFPYAVARKYSDDGGGYLAATISYYGFFSLFPLLLVLVTTLGFALQRWPQLEGHIVDTALGQLPVIGPQLGHHELKASGLALAIGLAASLWTGTGVLLAAEAAMARIWELPVADHAGFFGARLRALMLLGLLGGGLLLATLTSGAAAFGGSLNTAVRLVALAASLGGNFLLFWLAFRLLAPHQVPWSQLRGGAIAAALGYGALQLAGSYYMTHTLRRASEVYGTFALVIGILSWIYLTATVVLLAAEANVVAARRLWPRRIREPEPAIEPHPGPQPVRARVAR
jgi:membrane protein